MFELQRLSKLELAMCENTVSSNAFYMIVGSSLLRREGLSVVRMGDGEHHLWYHCKAGKPEELLTPDSYHSPEWLANLGCVGITKGELITRLENAAADCTYFAASISGIWRDDYQTHMLSYRQRYVDNFFVNEWTEEMQIALFKEARHVLLIHRNPETADAMQIRAKVGLGVKLTYLKMESWTETEAIIAAASKIDAPLALVSAGPAGKYIIPKIAACGTAHSKVVLDLGHSVDHWTLPSLPGFGFQSCEAK